MSRVLVVTCHPLKDSFVGAIGERAISALERSGAEVRYTDLYADGFTAEITAAEMDGQTVPDDVVKHHADLAWCERLVLVYPTWWEGQPALLKGWIDRLWRSGPRSATRLSNIRQIVIIATHGSSKFVNMVEGEGGKRTITRNLAVQCGLHTRSTWLAMYGVDTSSAKDRDRFLARVDRAMRRLA